MTSTTSNLDEVSEDIPESENFEDFEDNRNNTFGKTPDGTGEIFLSLFLFWRLVYNLLLGYLLHTQSNSKFMIRLCKKWGFRNTVGTFNKPKNEWVEFIQNQLQKKIGTEIYYDSLPIEFNAWLLFRALVDLVLTNDLACFVMFALCYYQVPEKIKLTDLLRFFGGTVLILFNIWVKVDAYRIVKDYSWYWGDFFFTIESGQKFNGVFELAPHPMYSLGYIGFYGTALITKSYLVLFASLGAHIAQFVFLHVVETPHNEKTSGTRELYKQNYLDHEIHHLYFRRDLIVIKNFDWFRSSDFFALIIAVYSVVLALMVGPANEPWKLGLYVGQAVFWRFIHTIVLGAVLHFQSTNKFWSRHFIKFGESPKDAFNHWKIIYNLSQTMTFLSFFICAWRLYSLPANWTYGTILLKHTLGLLLIGLHLWTAISIYHVLGDFGWFYGDFFIDELMYRSSRAKKHRQTQKQGKRMSHDFHGMSPQKFAHSRRSSLQTSTLSKSSSNAKSEPTLRLLRYSGIYRFVNNPEKIMGHAAFWGLSLITSSWVLFAITLFGQISNWMFLHYVETPHMKRLYGEEQVRSESGVQMVLRKEVKKVEKAVERVVEKIEEVTKDTMREVREKLFEGEEKQRGSEIDEELDQLKESWDEAVNDKYKRAVFDLDGNDDEDEITVRDAESDGLRKRIQSNLQRSTETEDDETSDDQFLFTGNRVKKSIRNRKKLKRLASFTDAVNAGRQAVHDLVEEVEKVVDQAAPRVRTIVQRVTETVTQREGIDPFQHLPLELYSLTFPSLESGKPRRNGPPRFRLGEPIIIEFTGPRETIKHNDWVGLYSITQNHRNDLTTSQSRGRWMFLTGMNQYDEDAPPSLVLKRPHATASPGSEQSQHDVLPEKFQFTGEPMASNTSYGAFGLTSVEIVPSSEPGLRLVRGRLTFRADKLPWTVGVYEARYHYDLKYHVLAISRPFEVVAEPFLLYTPDWKLTVKSQGSRKWKRGENGNHENTSENGVTSADEGELMLKAFEKVELCGDDLRSVYEPELNVPVEDDGYDGSSDSDSLKLFRGDEELKPFLLDDKMMVKEIEVVLREYVGRILDIEEDEEELGAGDDILSRVKVSEKCTYKNKSIFFKWANKWAVSYSKYQEVVSRRIVYAVKQVFGVEFSWKVVGFLRTTQQLAVRIHEAHVALTPQDSRELWVEEEEERNRLNSKSSKEFKTVAT
ncbi:phosphatidylethanolamine N-methyltransferase, partial [Nowakowskiella sp. JEL0407]